MLLLPRVLSGFLQNTSIFSGGRNLLSFRQKAVFGWGLLADHQELKYLLVPFYYNLGLSITHPSPGRLQCGRTSISKPCLWSPNNEAVWAAVGNRVYRDCFYSVLDIMLKFSEKTEKVVSRNCWEWESYERKYLFYWWGTNDYYCCLVYFYGKPESIEFWGQYHSGWRDSGMGHLRKASHGWWSWRRSSVL